LYDASALEEINTDGEISAIHSTEYGFRLFHEFPRQPGANALATVAPGWRDHIAVAATRHEERLRRLQLLDRPGNRILFVRHRFRSEADVADGEDPGAAVAVLWDALRCNWPSAEIRLLLVNFSPGGVLPEGVLRLDFEELPGPTREPWRGDEEQWRKRFASLGLAVRPRRAIRLRRSPGPPD
jgi:hypothetical protein